MTLISCSTYKIVDRHLNRKMNRADLELSVLTTSAQDSIEYWDSKDASKPVVLLVHGFGATTKYQWYKQVKLLSSKYRVIAPNLNYFGKTVPGTSGYGVQDQVDMLLRFADTLNLDTLTLIGVSYGGLVGIEFAQQYSGKVDQLVLFDTPVKFADSGDVASVSNYFDVSSIEELFVPSDPAGLNKLMFLATGKKTHIPSGWLKEFHAQAYGYNLDDKRKLITEMLNSIHHYQAQEYALEMPILLVWGSEDKVVPLETGKKLQNYLGDNCELQIIDGAAHMPNLTHKRTFNKILSRFLQIHK